MGGSSCSEEICAGDKEENQIREALEKKKNGGPSVAIKSRATQLL